MKKIPPLSQNLDVQAAEQKLAALENELAAARESLDSVDQLADQADALAVLERGAAALASLPDQRATLTRQIKALELAIELQRQKVADAHRRASESARVAAWPDIRAAAARLLDAAKGLSDAIEAKCKLADTVDLAGYDLASWGFAPMAPRLCDSLDEALASLIAECREFLAAG